MRVVLSLLVVGLAAVSADVTEEQPEVDPEGVAHADRDCSNLFCKDTNDGHAHFLPKLNQETGKCECGSYFTEGPCAGMQCAHFRAVRALMTRASGWPSPPLAVTRRLRLAALGHMWCRQNGTRSRSLQPAVTLPSRTAPPWDLGPNPTAEPSRAWPQPAPSLARAGDSPGVALGELPARASCGHIRRGPAQKAGLESGTTAATRNRASALDSAVSL